VGCIRGDYCIRSHAYASVCVRGCRAPHLEGLQPPRFLDVLSSGFRAVYPSRLVTRPVPTEAVSIRRGQFPRPDSNINPGLTGLIKRLTLASLVY